MSWKNTLYIVLVIVIAGGSALAGALAGGAVVYRTLQGQPANLPAPTQEIQPANGSAGQQAFRRGISSQKSGMSLSMKRIPM